MPATSRRRFILEIECNESTQAYYVELALSNMIAAGKEKGFKVEIKPLLEEHTDARNDPKHAGK